MSAIVEAPRPNMPYAVRENTFAPGPDIERILRDSQRCGWVTAYGMPWMEWCGARTVSGTPYCEEHPDCGCAECSR